MNLWNWGREIEKNKWNKQSWASELEKVLPTEAESPEWDNWRLSVEKEGSEQGWQDFPISAELQRPLQPHQACPDWTTAGPSIVSHLGEHQVSPRLAAVQLRALPPARACVTSVLCGQDTLCSVSAWGSEEVGPHPREKCESCCSHSANEASENQREPETCPGASHRHALLSLKPEFIQCQHTVSPEQCSLLFSRELREVAMIPSKSHPAQTLCATAGLIHERA